MRELIKIQFYVWCIGWATLLDGLLIVCSFGFYSAPFLARNTAKWAERMCSYD